MLLFKNYIYFSCKHGGDEVSTWAKFDGHIYPVIRQKYLPFIIYCELLFTHKVNCLQTCEHMSAHWAIKVCVFVYLLGSLRY